MKLTFLGTSCMMPTKERNHSGVLLNYKSEYILFDCGENMQRQLKIAEVSPARLTKILITHWHGDHILGLPGLLQSLIAHQYQKTLEIYGPKGTKEYLRKIIDLFVLYNGKIKLKIIEIEKGGIFYEDKEFQ